MNWRSAKDEHPSQDCQCLVQRRGYMLLYWNSRYQVWDDQEGDDYFCDKEEIDKWIPLVEIINNIK